MIDGARAFRWLGRLLAATVVAAIAHLPVGAHEARPAYLELTETQPGHYDVVWRTPVSAGLTLPVVLRFPDEAKDLIEPRLHRLPDSIVERRIVTVPGSLSGKRIEFVGLQGTITDVLVRMQTHDGVVSTALVRPSRPYFDIAATPGSATVATAYLVHGIEHILLGYDHLLFVSGAHPHRAETAGTGHDSHRLHAGTLDHACLGDPRFRARAGTADGGSHRTQHSSAGL